MFTELIREKIMVLYMDDIFIKASTEEEAVQRLERVLSVAAKHGLRFNWKKCQLVQRRVEFLGYIIENGTIKPSKRKEDDVRNFPQPTTVKQLLRFLGLCGYFRKFIEDYARIAKPLSDLTRKDAKFIWGEQQERAFITLKRALVGAGVLHLFNKNKETELHTDASKDGYGAILLQRCPEDKQMHPVYFMC